MMKFSSLVVCPYILHTNNFNVKKNIYNALLLLFHTEKYFIRCKIFHSIFYNKKKNDNSYFI